MSDQVRSLLRLAVLALPGILFSCHHEYRSGTADNRPNIILIMADDLGYETLEVNGGGSYRTPEINKMAARGMRFEHCYAQPLCTPTRIQLMTGIYNVRNYIRFGFLEPNQTTFGHLFQQAGYATCVVGKWQLGKDSASPNHAGFDNYCLWQVSEGRVDSGGRDTRYSKPVLEIDGTLFNFDVSDYGPEIVSRYGLDFIEKSHKEGNPFLLYYPMILTHCPFSPVPGSPEWDQSVTTAMTYKGDSRYFTDMVTQMDQIVGSYIEKVEELGIHRNTLIIFTGDNGTDEPIVSIMNGREIKGAKGKSTDAGTRVPLIVLWPGVVPPNTINSDLIDFTDFLPTMAEAAQIRADSMDLDGYSFLPQLKGETGRPRDWIYSWFSRNGDPDDARVFARTHRYKLYDSGEFYDLTADLEEQYPMDTIDLDSNTIQIYHRLTLVLEHYKKRRLDRIQATGL